MSKSNYTMDKVTITTRKGTHVRTLSPKEIKRTTKYDTFHYGGKNGGENCNNCHGSQRGITLH